MKARIINSTYFGGIYSDDYLELNTELISEWRLTDLLPNLPTDIWNGLEWIEGRTQEEIEEANKPIVPKQLSRMKFKMQVLITTGKTYEEIIAFIQGLPMSEFYKKLLLIRLEDCVMFERYSEDLLTIAQMMGITEEQLDDIFINGNLID